MRRRIILLALGCLAIAACGREEVSPERYLHTVTLDFRADSIHSVTKSCYLESIQDESRIKNATIIISDEYGDIMKEYVTGSSIELDLKPGMTYNFDVLVNMGDLRPSLDSHDDALSYRHAVSNESISRDGLPMYGHKEITMTESTSRIVVNADRLVARYEFRFSPAGITSGSMMVKDIQMKNVAGIVSPQAFSAAVVDEIIEFGDHASASDIVRINQGLSAVFYIPENLQGTEYGIHIPSDKIPTYGYSSVDPDLCSYLEVTCSYLVNGCGTADDVVYRMYLGANSTNDFNICRNTQYALTLQPTDVNPEMIWWKCEPRFEIEKVLEVSPSEAWLNVGESQQFQAQLVKKLHGQVLEQREVTQSCTWDIAAGSQVLAYSGNGCFSAEELGTTYIQASYAEWTSEWVPVHVENRRKNVIIDITANSGTSTVFYGVTATNGVDMANCYCYGSTSHSTKTVSISQGSGHDIFRVSTSTVSDQSGLDYLVYDVSIDGEHFINCGEFSIDWSELRDERHEIIVTPVFPGTRTFTLYATPPNGANGLSVGLSYVNNPYDSEANVEAGRGIYFLTTEANYGVTTSATKSIQVFGDKFRVSGYRVFGSTASLVEIYANGRKIYSGQIGTETSTNRFETPIFDMTSNNMVIQAYLK